MEPVYDPEVVADAIVSAAERPRREIFAGGVGRVLAWQHVLAPGLTERMMARQVETKHFQDAPARPSAGNLFEPTPEWASVDGGWGGGRSAAPLGSVGLAGLMLAAVPAGYWAWRQLRG